MPVLDAFTLIVEQTGSVSDPMSTQQSESEFSSAISFLPQNCAENAAYEAHDFYMLRLMEKEPARLSSSSRVPQQTV